MKYEIRNLAKCGFCGDDKPCVRLHAGTQTLFLNVQVEIAICARCLNDMDEALMDREDELGT